MKNRLYKRRPKRTTLGKMFAKAMIIPVVFTLIFSFVLYFAMEYIACEQAQGQQEQLNSILMEAAVATEDKNDKMGGTINSLRMKMCLGTYYQALNYSEFFGNRFHLPETGVTSFDDKTGSAVTAIIDKDGNVMISNAAKMFCVIKFDENLEHNKWFYCDPEEIDIPEFQYLIREHIDSEYSSLVSYTYDITEAYVNVKEHKMIPHVINIITSYCNNGYIDEEPKKEEQKEFVIGVGSSYLDGYELMKFSADKSVSSDEPIFPACSFENIWGIEKAKVDEAISSHFIQGMSGHAYESDYDLVMNESMTHNSILINGERCTLFSDYRVNVWTEPTKKMYCIFIIIFFLLLTFIDFLICWRKNVKNKAQYAFEDYQRALTNNLAHDIKTPLAVIGGFAENLIEMHKDTADEKELAYLSSIMDNVAYTDNIVSRTLQLSQNEQIKKLNKKKVDIKALTEKLSAKYKTALDERQIKLELNGRAEITADEELLASAVENLISNAVKYTKDGGNVTITVDKKHFNIVNDVVENIDTKDLLMPFVKGDKARSDKRSSGLGLSIAAAAAEKNGFQLKIECKDKKFKAVIRF